MISSANGDHFDIARMSLNKGADIKAVNNYGLTSDVSASIYLSLPTAVLLRRLIAEEGMGAGVGLAMPESREGGERGSW